MACSRGPHLSRGTSPGQGRAESSEVCFLLFWAINLFVIHRGIDSIRLLLEIKAPLLIVLGLALLAWAYREAGGFGLMLNQPSQFSVCGPKAGGFWTFFFPPLMANVGDSRRPCH